MSYRSNSNIPQKTPDGLAEKIQRLGAYLLLPEERDALSQQPDLLARLAQYLDKETRKDLAGATCLTVPTPTYPLLRVGKATHFSAYRERMILKWTAEGRPETQTRKKESQNPADTWKVITTDYPGNKNRVYLKSDIDGTTLLIHKSTFILLWEMPKPTGRNTPYPPNPKAPDNVEEPKNLIN